MIKKKYIWIFAVVAVALIAATLLLRDWSDSVPGTEDQQQEEAVQLLYGIDSKHYVVEEGVIENGETLSTILAPYGVGAAVIDRVSKVAEPVFSLRNMRAGHNYTLFLAPDTTRKVVNFVYEQSVTEYIVFSFEGDSVSVRREQKPVSEERKRCSGTITSSLWNCMIENNMTPALAMDLSDIYAWSIDFFGLQEGDNFTVIYDEKFVDSTSVGAGRIWGAIFNHAGKTYYAIPFIQNGKITYWDEQGNSLRKNLLKAPLKFSRISSRFSNSRLHPVLKIRRPHHGVDYSAPSGTPVQAVADGVVIYKGYSGGGGNTIKIRHSSNLMSGYLHLRGYGKGIANGARVSQGQIIGYVGTTGLSTGPHLDFRLWRSGKPIDPLKVPSEPAEPISAANKADFNVVKNRIIAELEGRLVDSLIVRQLDSVKVYTNQISTQVP